MLNFQIIFTRDSIYAICSICHSNSVCPSVRPSVTRVLCVKTAEHIVEILSLPDRPIIVFRHKGRCLNLTASLQRGHRIQGGGGR